MRNGESGSDNLLRNQTLFCGPIKGERKIAVLAKGQEGNMLERGIATKSKTAAQKKNY